MARYRGTFEKLCRMSQEELSSYMLTYLEGKGYEPILGGGFIFAPGSVPVLLVAHMDTAHKQPCKIICWSDNGVAMSPQGIGGDDRCGVFAIREIVKELQCSVLLCEDEEIGGVGARAFAGSGISADVNFCIEFDRRGSKDCVFYDCDNRDFVKFIEKHGFREEYGSFSDISVVAPYLGVAAVNLSSGYYNEHTAHESVSLPVLLKNIEKAKGIIQAPEASKRFEYIPAVHNTYGIHGGYGGYGCYDWSGWDDRGWNGRSTFSLGKRTGSIHRRQLMKVPEGSFVYYDNENGELLEVDEWAIDDDYGLYIRVKGDARFEAVDCYKLLLAESGEEIVFDFAKAKYYEVNDPWGY